MNVGVWWANHRDTTLRLLAIAGSYISLLGLVPVVHEGKWSSLMIGLAVLFLLLTIGLLVLEFKARPPQTVYAKEDSAGIRAYMEQWIAKGGRVAIWSRDLTWANTPSVKDRLLEKAHNNELVLCVPQATPLSNELSNAGAEVRVYAAGNYAPASRFTIIDFGKQGARVAVGRAQGDFHIIDEFDATTHPAFYLAQDLVDLVRALQAPH